MKFVSFHSHTTYSYGDGYGTVEQHVNRIHELGMSALGISEHGNVNSHAALEREANLKGIKPIFGIEAYLGPTGDKRTQAKTHLTIFAMNEEGYHNLNKLVTKSWIQHHYFPTISPSDLRKYNAGLVVLSGCSDSLISCTLLGGKFLGDRREPDLDKGIDKDSIRRTNRKLEWFTSIFGPDRFFLEVQRFPRLSRTCAINQTFADLSRSTGIPLIATADVHYPRATDAPMQAMLHAARWPSTRSDFGSEAAWEFQANLSYPESDDEIINDLEGTGLSKADAESAVSQTALLALRCNVELPKARPLRFKTPAGKTAAEHLRKLVVSGWNRRVQQRPDLSDRKMQYFDRAKSELAVINPKDFNDYFLATTDLVNYAKSQDITVGPGRGSAAGSVVCYLLGITEIDPLHPVFSKMIFERFIDKNRSDMPDIDVDFDDEKRWMIPARAREIYGNENVANVSNHIKYRGRKALQDVCRAYNLPLKTFEEIAKRITDRVETDDRVDDSLSDVIESYAAHPKVAALVDNFPYQIKQAIDLEGNQHSMGTHAGGFAIASDPIPEVCPIYNKNSGQGRAKKQIQVIPYEKRDAEHLGLLKMDFLGLSTMGMIGLCREWTGMSLDELYSLFYRSSLIHDPQGDIEIILQKFRDDDCMGIFQYEGATTRQVVRDVSPDNFDELAACNALSRPGPLYGGQTSEYIAVKRGEKDWERYGPGYDEHVGWTYGQIVFQEQIMWILRDFANFPTDRVIKVRKIIGKKLGEFQFVQLWDEFRNGCADNGVSEEDAHAVWSGITTAAGYAFNTSHSYAYALIAWWQMWFKIHHPTEFFASSLAKNGDTKDNLPRRVKLLQDAVAHGRQISEFSVSMAMENWSVSNDVIFPGFQQIPDIGEATAKDIVAHIDSIPTDLQPNDELGMWMQIMGVSGIGAPTVEKMIAWTKQEDPFRIFHTSKQLNTFRKQLENDEFVGTGLPEADIFFTTGEPELSDPDSEQWIAWAGLVSNVHHKDEIESIRQKSGKSFEEAYEQLAKKGDPDKSKKCTIFAYDEDGEVALRVSRWVYDNLDRQITAIEPNHHIAVVYGRVFTGRPNSIQVRNLWVLNPD